jgi:hypothetical protein
MWTCYAVLLWTCYAVFTVDLSAVHSSALYRKEQRRKAPVRQLGGMQFLLQIRDLKFSKQQS